MGKTERKERCLPFKGILFGPGDKKQQSCTGFLHDGWVSITAEVPFEIHEKSKVLLAIHWPIMLDGEPLWLFVLGKILIRDGPHAVISVCRHRIRKFNLELIQIPKHYEEVFKRPASKKENQPVRCP